MKTGCRRRCGKDLYSIKFAAYVTESVDYYTEYAIRLIRLMQFKQLNCVVHYYYYIRIICTLLRVDIYNGQNYSRLIARHLGIINTGMREQISGWGGGEILRANKNAVRSYK